MQNQPPEKYASSTQSSPVSAVIPQLGSGAVRLHVMLKRAPEGWKIALPSRPPTRFPRSQANSIPPRAPRRAIIHARYVRNILNIIIDCLRRQRETAALREARAAARCLSGSQCLPKREGHASSQTATSKFLPRDFSRPPLLPRVIKRLSILFRTVYCGHTAGKRVENMGSA